MKNKFLGFGSFFCGINFVLVWILCAIKVMPPFGNEYAEVPASLVLMGLIPIFLFLIIDTIHAARNPILSGKDKARWIVLLWGCHVIVFPIYWAKYQRQDHRTEEESEEN